jgi:hypothetical protein
LLRLIINASLTSWPTGGIAVIPGNYTAKWQIFRLSFAGLTPEV